MVSEIVQIVPIIDIVSEHGYEKVAYAGIYDRITEIRAGWCTNASQIHCFLAPVQICLVGERQSESLEILSFIAIFNH